MAASLYADFVVCPSCTYGEVFGAFLLEDGARQEWLQNMQRARKGFYSPTAQVYPRNHVAGLRSSAVDAYFVGVQAGLATLRMNTTSMYIMLD